MIQNFPVVCTNQNERATSNVVRGFAKKLLFHFICFSISGIFGYGKYPKDTPFAGYSV